LSVLFIVLAFSGNFNIIVIIILYFRGYIYFVYDVENN